MKKVSSACDATELATTLDSAGREESRPGRHECLRHGGLESEARDQQTGTKIRRSARRHYGAETTRIKTVGGSRRTLEVSDGRRRKLGPIKYVLEFGTQLKIETLL